MSLFYRLLVMLGAVDRGEEFGDRLQVCDDGISHVHKGGYALFRDLRVACAAGVADENGNDAEIGGVTACRFDTDLGRHTHHRYGLHLGPAQSQL